MASTQVAPVNLPRVAITYCTQCRWMLRAAYFGQELLSTFGTQIGEIALIPATGGLFQVELTYLPPTDESTGGDVKAEKVLLWDRKTEGGFPETKVLKQRVRDKIDPKKDLGHSDVGGKKKDAVKVDEPKIQDVKVDGNVERNAEEMVKDLEIDEAGEEEVKRNPDGTVCEDCR